MRGSVRLRALCAALLATTVIGCRPDGITPEAAAPEVPGDAGLLARISEPVPGRRLHLVRAGTGTAEHAFDPPELTIRSGDVVRFVASSHLPESVVFDTAGVTPEVRDFVVRADLLHGSLLTRPGQIYDVAFDDAPPGEYPFHSRPHQALEMRGRIVVE